MRDLHRVRMVVHQADLEKALYTIQPLQNQLIPSIKFDPGLAIDTLCTEFGTELAFWFCTIAPRLSGATYFTRDRCPSTRIVDSRICVPPF